MRAHTLVSLATLVVLVLLPSVAGAQRVRVHGTAAGTHAVGGHQQRELSWGGATLAAGELPLLEQLGIQLEVGGLWLAAGKPPKDPTLKPEGAASAYFGAVGLQARPFSTEDPRALTRLSGLWLSADAGVTTTGGRVRMLVDTHLGYDFLLEQGRFGVGPTVGLVHVFQSDDQLRPDDANLFLLGVHGMFDSRTKKEPGDRDGDGILDPVDKCPDVPEDKDGYEDEDGCPDKDNDADGIPDSADSCPNDPEDADQFQDEDGCPDEDNDKDGIYDEQDACPNDPEDMDHFEDEDGCPDPDNDQDRILDGDDLCPNEPENYNDYADHDGCPDEEQIRVVGKKIVLDDRIHFRTNNATIRTMSYPLLERLSKLLREHPEYVHIEIQGHTDRRGTDAFNDKLSKDRAQAVADFLVEHGIDEGRLSTVGFGSRRPLVDENTERAWFLNRRVEFVITRQVEKVIRSGGPQDRDNPQDAAPPDAGGEEADGAAGDSGQNKAEEEVPERQDTAEEGGR